jgi:hypothetical protein
VRLDSRERYDKYHELIERIEMPRDRLREPEARILALRIAASRPNREASMTYIKDHIEDYITLTEIDLKPSLTRSQEQRWQQITGNIVSHQMAGTSLFNKGFAERTSDGIRVTDLGIAHLIKLGVYP